MPNARPLRIGLLVVNRFRDLPGQVLTAMRLCQEGCTSLLISSGRMIPEIWTLAPDVMVIDSVRRGKRSLVTRMARAGIQVGVHEGEGGVFPDIDAYLAKMTPNPEALSSVSGYYSWGPRVARELVAAGRLSSEQVTVTGTPRMDFYADHWRTAAMKLNPVPEGLRRPFVLLNGTFNMVNPWGTDIDMVRREYRGDGHDFDTFRNWVETQRLAMRQFIDLARHLAARLPEIGFVYRPHPFEATESYNGCFDGIPNLQLIKQGTVQGWILRASALVHSGSSTAIDAALLGVPAFSPSWIQAHLQLPTVEASSLKCDSEDELVERIRKAAAGDVTGLLPSRSTVDDVITDWYLAVDGRGYDRLATAILHSVKSDRDVSLSQCRRALDQADGPKASLRFRMRYWTRKALNLPVHWSFQHWKDEPPAGWDGTPAAFGVDEVRSIVNALEPTARELHGPSWRSVWVRSATEQGEYNFGYKHGRSIALTSA